jgi:hypothetical protein
MRVGLGSAPCPCRSRLAGSGHRWRRVREGPITHCRTSIHRDPSCRFTGQSLPARLVTRRGPGAARPATAENPGCGVSTLIECLPLWLSGIERTVSDAALPLPFQAPVLFAFTSHRWMSHPWRSQESNLTSGRDPGVRGPFRIPFSQCVKHLPAGRHGLESCGLEPPGRLPMPDSNRRLPFFLRGGPDRHGSRQPPTSAVFCLELQARDYAWTRTRNLSLFGRPLYPLSYVVGRGWDS